MQYVYNAGHPGVTAMTAQQLAEQHFAGHRIEPTALPAPSQNIQVAPGNSINLCSCYMAGFLDVFCCSAGSGVSMSQM